MMIRLAILLAIAPLAAAQVAYDRILDILLPRPNNPVGFANEPADATDTGLAPIAVSVRICLATEKVCWNSRFTRVSILPAVTAAW